MIDIKRLREWVLREKEVCGSYGKLARTLSRVSEYESEVTPQSLQNWVSVGVKSLSMESVVAIAAYRGESIDQTMAWLLGKSPSLNKAQTVSAEAQIKDWIASAPIAEVATIVLLGVQRLAASTQPSSMCNPPCHPLKHLIELALQAAGYDPNDPQAWEALIRSVDSAYAVANPFEYKNRRTKLEVLRVHGINTFDDSESESDLVVLAEALDNLSGHPYTADELRHYIKNSSSLGQRNCVATN